MEHLVSGMADNLHGLKVIDGGANGLRGVIIGVDDKAIWNGRDKACG